MFAKNAQKDARLKAKQMKTSYLLLPTSYFGIAFGAPSAGIWRRMERFDARKGGGGVAGFLGFLAGLGMVALVAALILRFLRQMGLLKSAQVRLIARCLGGTAAAGTLYLLFAMVYVRVTRGALVGLLDLGGLFQGPYLRRMMLALSQPEALDPVSSLFAFLGRTLGKAFFGQSALTGLLLAWGLSAAGLGLIQARLTSLTGKENSAQHAFLLLCLPGSVFFLLPGWPCLMLFAGGLLFYWLGKRAKGMRFHLPDTVYEWLVGVSAVMSAAVTVGAIHGRLG